MARAETEKIAVCAVTSALLESLVGIVRETGGWDIVPIEWPDGAAILEDARRNARALLLHSGEVSSGRPPVKLCTLLRGRPEHTPLIVVGQEPMPAAGPSVWLPTVPTAPLLAQVLDQLLGSAPVAAPQDGPTWRRKSDMIIGDSPAIREILHTLDQLASAQTPVLITGESGVGKELVARSLHYTGSRAKAPFIALNCAAIPENLIEAELFGYQRGAFTGAIAAHAGAFEAADQGTLFLDEIGEMPLAMQSKLLRVLETSEVQRVGSTERKKVNFRLVTATNRNLEVEVKHGRFREDLFYRVLVYPIHVPPLRERIEDLPRLVTHHLSAIGARDGRPALRLSPAALERLLHHSWPGNVRELVNVLERAALLARNSVIDGEHINFAQVVDPVSGEMPALMSYRDAKARFEHDYYAQLMRAAGGNVTLAAKLGQKTRKEIYDALRRNGLDTMGNEVVRRRRATTHR
jgi:transcriptional regulator with GAF, ATPase, and Fis domain